MARQIEIPRGKLIGMNGPGSIYIDTEGSSYIVGAVDRWYESGNNLNMNSFKINDTRLEKLLNVYGFREAPMYKDVGEKKK